METAPNSNDSRPYLSVVVTARNDDHGGNLLRRMQTFVNALLAQGKRHEVPCELVVVDWNPPPGKPPLVDALRWPADTSPVDVRFIEVPPELHGTYRHGEALPLYQMIAKNVGIRRARGRFILVTNIDVVFSHALFEFFAQQRLQPGRMYRVDRYDAMEDVPVDAPIDEQLRYCEQHLIRINTRQGTFPVTPDGQRLIEPGDITSPESGITFGGGWYPLEGAPTESFRWVLDEADIHLPPLSEARSLILDLEPGPGVAFLPFGLRITGHGGALLQEAAVMRRQTVAIRVEPSREPTTIRLHLLGGGQQTADDPRILNFRAFSVEWDRPLEALTPGARVAGEAGLRKPLGQPPPRLRLGLMSIPRRAWGGLSKLRSATGPVEIGLPLPAFLVERWRLRLRGSSVTVTLDPAWFRPWRRRGERQPTKPRDLVPEGLDLLWGRGWYPQENFRGDSYRWAQDGAEIVLRTPAGQPRLLRLLVEPGPALGYGPFHLRLVDGSGKTCATATVSRRQWIDLPLPWRPDGTQVLSFQTSGDTPARALPNDSRNLYFRVLACDWAHADGSAPADGAQSDGTRDEAAWTPMPRSPGILLGAGWKTEFPREGGPMRWSGSPGAEMILQRRPGPKGIVVLGVEPPEGEAVELIVRQGERPLATFRIHKHEQLRLGPALREGQTGVLRLSAARWSDDPAAKGSPCPFRLVSATWDGPGRPVGAPPAAETNGPAPGGPEAQSLAGAGEQSLASLDAAAPPDPSAEPVGPEFLHTNACGDFTLLAREHWFSLRGYPEFDLFSMNIDSVFCYSAHHGGAPEEFLPDPMRVYHIEHATGSGFTPEGQARLFERIAAKGIPWIDYQQVMDWAVEMRRLNAPLIFNLEDWGFANVDLAERRPPARTGAASSRHTTRGV